MSILRTYNLQNPDSATTNIELTVNGGAVATGIVTATGGLNVGAGGTVITTTSGGRVGLGTLTPTTSLDVVGDARITGILTAGQYNITTHVPIQNGTFSTASSNGTVSGTFTLPVKSNCLFSFNGTGYKNSGNTIIMTLSVTGIGNLTSISYYTNEIASHKSSTTGYVTATLNAGTWTAVITCDSNTDNNDRGNCSVVAIPTL